MIKVLKKAGLPLLAAGFIAMELTSARGGPIFNLSAGLMVVGGLLLVTGRFFGSRAIDEAVMKELEEDIRREKEREAGGAVPSPDGVDTGPVEAGVPGWIYGAGAFMTAAGSAMFFFGPNGVSEYTVGSFALIPAGILLIIGGIFFYGGGPTRRNMLRGALVLFSAMIILAGIFLGVFIFAGAFAPGQGGPYGALALVLISGGLPGVYYGMKYQQSQEGRAIGRELGFTDASGGGEDAHYDSKGVANGVAVLLDIDQRSVQRNTPAAFSLEVLCRCANPAGIRLSVKPEGMLSLPAGGPPRVDAVPYWDYFEVRCDQTGEALRVLPEFRKGPNVFGDDAGFSEMSLEGREFRFFFSLEGYAGTAYVRRVVQEVSLLASRFN